MIGSATIVCLLLAVCVSAGHWHGDPTSNNGTSSVYMKFVVELRDPLNGPVQGKVEFVRYNSWDKRWFITGRIQGLAPGKHGFHIHEFGTVSESCGAAGGHYNKFQQNHGAPNSVIRHIGDLGNIQADASGVAEFRMVDSVICSRIAGRAVVIHSGEDDLGLGGFSDSLTTGHAGSRVACGPIVVAEDGGED